MTYTVLSGTLNSTIPHLVFPCKKCKTVGTYCHQIWYTRWPWGTVVLDWFLAQRVRGQDHTVGKRLIARLCLSRHRSLLTFTRWCDDMLLTTCPYSQLAWLFIYLFIYLFTYLLTYLLNNTAMDGRGYIIDWVCNKYWRYHIFCLFFHKYCISFLNLLYFFKFCINSAVILELLAVCCTGLQSQQQQQRQRERCAEETARQRTSAEQGSEAASFCFVNAPPKLCRVTELVQYTTLCIAVRCNIDAEQRSVYLSLPWITDGVFQW